MHISKLELKKAYSRVRPFVLDTPLLSNTYLDDAYEAEFFIKCEQFQTIGAFKIRGAANFISQINKEDLQKGVVTHSSGNHAQALAFMAYKKGINATVVMPKNSNKLKILNVKKWGANVILCEPTIEDRVKNANEIVKTTGAILIPPYDHEYIISGQATAAMEMFRKVKDLDYLITPLGGGGLLSGTAMAALFFSPNTKVIGAEPVAANDGYLGFKNGIRQDKVEAKTIADGLRTTVGLKPFELIKQHVSDIWLAEEEKIIENMYTYWQQVKHIIEPSCAVPLAAIEAKKKELKGKRIGIIITGGNVDFNSLPPYVG